MTPNAPNNAIRRAGFVPRISFVARRFSFAPLERNSRRQVCLKKFLKTGK
jgi:hypothetical protein